VPLPQDPQRPFERDAFFDDPGIVGARWWNRAFEGEVEATRRQAVKALAAIAIVIGGVAVLGVGGVAAAIAHAPDRKLRKAIDLQRQLGWNVGAPDEPLTWTWPTTLAVDARAALGRLATTLHAKRYAPFQVLTQLEAITAAPTTRLASDSSTPRSLVAEVKPGRSPQMDADLKSGQSLATTFSGRDLKALVIVDCEGPRSVAFAVGASRLFEPVFILDNWPHPTGAVPAHHTLGALASFEPELSSAAAARAALPPPLFVLDRSRNTPLVDAEEVFDNRYFATLPNATTLSRWGIARVLLVVQSSTSLPEAGDLAVSLAEYAAGGLDVRCIGMSSFDWSGAYSGGPDAFFHHVPWAPAVGPAPAPLEAGFATWRPGAPSTHPSPKAPGASFGQAYAYEREGVLVSVPFYGGTRDRSPGGSNGG